MKELKFRAWDKDTAKYTDGVGELYVDILEVGTKTYRIEQMCPGRYIIELFTGLKDKNGKEIYEGDIVDYNDDGECIGVVVYDAPEFCLNADATNWARMFLKGAPHQRVIGNIHENPELCGEEEE